MYRMVPETKGKSLEDIELHFLGRAMRYIQQTLQYFANLVGFVMKGQCSFIELCLKLKENHWEISNCIF